MKKCKNKNKNLNGFVGCGENKVIFRYGICRECWFKFLKSEKSNDYIKKMLPKAKRKTEILKKQKRIKEKKDNKQKSDYEKLLQKKVNKIARMLDVNTGCHSCERPYNWNGRWDGGHFYSVGSNPTIRYNLHNIYKQCMVCNHFKHANDRAYKEKLIKIFGVKHFNEKILSLKQMPAIHLSKNDLIEKNKIANEILRDLKQGKDYTRDEINEKLGIYKKNNYAK